MSKTNLAMLLTIGCIALAGCSSQRGSGSNHSPVGLKSGCGQSGAPIPFTRGGGDQFYYCPRG